MKEFIMCELCPLKEEFTLSKKEISNAKRNLTREKNDFLRCIEIKQIGLKAEREEIEETQKMLKQLFLELKSEIAKLQVEENEFFDKLQEFETAEYRDKARFEKINEQIKENRKFLMSRNFKIVHNCENETKEISLAEYLEKDSPKDNGYSKEEYVEMFGTEQ